MTDELRRGVFDYKMGSYLSTFYKSQNPSIDIEQFVKRCKNAETGEDLLRIAEMYVEIQQQAVMGPLFLYQEHIGWALPSQQTCQKVVDIWKQFPYSRIVDFGAGTGLFCKVFHHLGISQDKLLAVDLHQPTHAKQTKQFWPIHRDDDYHVDVNDILFVAWGSGITNVIDDYVDSGGFCVMILGEVDYGCTTPANYFENIEGWDMELIHVPGPASAYTEHLSINIKMI